MNKNFGIYLIIFLFLPTTLSAFELTYAFFYQTPSEEIKSIDYEEGRAELNPGDQMKLYFKTAECIYLYVILEDARGDMLRITPRVFSDCGNNTPLQQGLYIPNDLNWFPPFKGKGDETFYLIVSVKRLFKLESLLKDFREKKREDPQSGQAMDAQQAVLEKIRTLMIENFPFGKDIKRDMQMVAATFRGGESYSFPAEKVIVDTMFIKTVTLSH